MASDSPVQLDLSAPEKVARWRVLGNPIMAIPHMIFLYVLMMVSSVVSFISFFTVLFTGNVPEGMYDLQVGIMRYQWRVISFALYLREPYPTFGIPSGQMDPGGDPATLSITRPAKMHRLLIFVKWLLIIPQAIEGLVLFIVMYVVMVISFLAVLILGKYPTGLRNFVVGVVRFAMRINAYTNFLTDSYPPFGLS